MMHEMRFTVRSGEESATFSISRSIDGIVRAGDKLTVGDYVFVVTSQRLDPIGMFNTVDSSPDGFNPEYDMSLESILDYFPESHFELHICSRGFQKIIDRKNAEKEPKRSKIRVNKYAVGPKGLHGDLTGNLCELGEIQPYLDELEELRESSDSREWKPLPDKSGLWLRRCRLDENSPYSYDVLQVAEFDGKFDCQFTGSVFPVSEIGGEWSFVDV